jgi:predicted transcriptional regulator of viral defense system
MHDEIESDMRGLEAEAYEQNGYFNAGQARAHAVSRQLLGHHVRQGRFKRLRRGLYRVQGFPTSEHDDLREAWMAIGGSDALLCSESALAMLNLSDNIPDAVHLLVPRRRRGLRRPRNVILHTHPDSEEIPTVWRDGLPLTAPARTLAEVAHSIQPEQLSMAVHEALRRGLLTPTQLQEQPMSQRTKRQFATIMDTEAHP